jgi:autotransporter translocation and assembly factor TamB
VDLKRAEILLPSDSDAVYGKISTNQFDLALFNNYVDGDMLRNLRGSLNGEVTVAGPLGDLETVGRMELSNGSMRVVPAGITLDEMGFMVNFRPDLIELQQLHIQSSPGRLRGNGYMALDNLTPGELNFTLRATQFRAANTSEYNAIVDLDSQLQGTMDQPSISGSLSFLRGFVNLQNFGERSVEDVQLEGEEEVGTFAYYDSLAIDMDVNFNRQFFIRNQQFLDMEIELAGQVDLLKDQGRELQMFGSLEGVRGYARPLGKNFMLDQAVVSFFGPVDNPELNIRTQYEPLQAQADVRIYYIIEGTALEPTFRFESEPELELQDIISYTLFGKPFYELESWEQTVAGSGSSPSATDLAVDVLLDRVETIASQRLGIDVVEIDNSRAGSKSTTSIKTGWYLNRRTFFAILNEISSSDPNTLFLLEYMLTNHLELILTQGDDSREGVDIRWNYDY